MSDIVFKIRQVFTSPSHKRTLSLIVILLIIAAVPLTVFISQKQQEIRQRASVNTFNYPISVPVLSLQYFPTVPCYNLTQKIDLSSTIISSNSQPMDPFTTPDKLIDENIPGSKWAPTPPFSNVNLTIDLGSIKSFKAFSFYFWASDRPESYHVDISQTGNFNGEETRIITETNGLTGYYPYRPNDPIQRRNYVFNQVNARYIKFTIDKFRNDNSDNLQVNFYEFEIYQNAGEKKCLDNGFIGDQFSARSTPDMSDPLSEIRNRVASHNQGLITSRNNGSKYHGFSNVGALPSLNYSIFEDKEYLTKIPGSTVYQSRPDYMGILNNLNICDYVENKGVKEIWVWSYHNSESVPEESDMAMGRNSQSFWNMPQSIPQRKRQVAPNAQWGDLSNSSQENDLPVCNKTYTLYNFTYDPDYSNAMHDYIHQIENLMEYMDREMFWDMFVGGQYGFQGPRRCGHSHSPPNSNSGYDYSSTSFISTDCEAWKPINCLTLDQNAPCGGIRTNINCTRWDCNPTKYYIWWTQNIPGMNNNLTYNGTILRNWWDFVGDFDNAIAQGKSLVTTSLIPTNTSTQTPTPTLTLTPTEPIPTNAQIQLTNTPTPTIRPTSTPTPTPKPTTTLTNVPANSPTPTTTTYHPADVNHDGHVCRNDLDLWIRAYLGTDNIPYSYYPDINSDGVINLLDYNAWYNAMQNVSINHVCQ